MISKCKIIEPKSTDPTRLKSYYSSIRPIFTTFIDQMAQKIDRSTQAQTKTNSNPAENSHTNSKTQQEPSPRLPGQLHRPRPKSQPDKTKIKRPTKYKQIKKETQIIVLLEFFIIIIHGYLILFSLQLPLLSLTLKTTQNPTTPAHSFSDPQTQRWVGLTCGAGGPTHFIFFTFFIVLCDMSLSGLFQHSLLQLSIQCASDSRWQWARGEASGSVQKRGDEGWCYSRV